MSKSKREDPSQKKNKKEDDEMKSIEEAIEDKVNINSEPENEESEGEGEDLLEDMEK
jgi:hypothetical protein